jgi:cobalt-zinc-cadmium efflux system protein
VHGPGEHHHHAHGQWGRSFVVGISLQTLFIVLEVIVGLRSHSLAVLSDAGHNVSDVLALGLAFGAQLLAKRGASKGRTYGLRSASILAALVNSLTLVFVNGAVAWEAVGRFVTPAEVVPLPMIFVSLLGVAVNGFCAWLFAKDSHDDVNVRAAFLHLASDAAVAAGVALTGVAIYFSGFRWLDPVASLIVAAVVLVSTLSLLRQTINLAMHAVPQGIDEDAVRACLAEAPGVVEVHDLHVWALSTSENAMTAHITVKTLPQGRMACELDEKIRGRFRIHHVTIQIDLVGTPCRLASGAGI